MPEAPFCLSVRASTNTVSASSKLLIQILAPLITQPLPSCFAWVDTARAAPPPGSLCAKQRIFRPSTNGSR